MSNWFELARTVPFPDVVALCGLDVGRDHKCICPFHDDAHPSFQVYEDHGYCFSCNKAADGVDLVARVYNLAPLDAAKWLCAQFGLSPSLEGDPELTERRRQRQQQREERERASRLCDSLCDMIAVVRGWRDALTPTRASLFRSAKMDPRLGQILHWYSYLSYVLEEYLDIDKTTETERLHLWIADVTSNKELYAFGKELKGWKK